MSNMQETLSILITGPMVKEQDFDEVSSSFGNNETLYSFDIHDYVHFSCDGSEDRVVTDKKDLDDNYLDVLLQYVYGYSNDTDSNEISQKLVDEYRNFTLETLKS